MIRSLRLFIGLFLLCCYTTTALSAWCDDDHPCLGIIDAGSTGSRLHVYRYTQTPDGHFQSLHELWQHQIKPGIASLPAEHHTFQDYLDHLFEQAPFTFPVFFYGTGGMRLLSDDDQKNRYELIQTWFDQHTAWPLHALKTISGEEEGLNAWFATNTISGSFDEAQASRIALMDMGGASIQIVFPVKPNTIAPTIKTIHFQHKTYRLWIQSILKFGQNFAREQFQHDPDCFPQGYALSNTMQGTGDITRCDMHMTNWFNQENTEFHAIKKQLKQNHFIWHSLGGINYLIEQTLYQHHDDFTPQNLYTDTETFCHTPWSQDDASSSTAWSCLIGTYYHHLIKHRYGLLSDTSIHTLNHIDWALGAAVRRIEALHKTFKTSCNKPPSTDA